MPSYRTQPYNVAPDLPSSCIFQIIPLTLPLLYDHPARKVGFVLLYGKNCCVMTSREDALFDENKYYFPEGVAAILKERTEQPWLEVTAERDEQGTPGLQPVPDEQKYVQQLNVSGIKGLYEDTEYLPAHAVANGPYAAAAGPPTLAVGHAAGQAVTPPLAPTTSYNHVPASEEQQSHDGTTESSLTEPWSQPETTNSYGQEHQQQPSRAPSTRPEIQYHHSWTSSIGSEHNNQSVQPQAEHAQQQWSLAVPYQTYGCQPPVTSQTTNQYNQGHSPQFAEYRGGQTPSQTSQYSHSSVDISSQYSGGNPIWGQGQDTRALQPTDPEIPLIKDTIHVPLKQEIPSARRTRRHMWWLIAGVFGLIAIGTIVGGVVGSRHSGNDSGASPNSSSAATYQMTSIRRHSRLAVTGYRGASGNYTLRLFFQDQDHNVRFMDKSSTGGIWTEPVTLDTLSPKPKPYGSIAAGSYIYNDPVSTCFAFPIDCKRTSLTHGLQRT